LTVSDTTSSTASTGLLGTARVKRGMAEMLKGGVIMDVVTPDQAKIAEDAGAVAVMALERVHHRWRFHSSDGQGPDRALR
jgi:pyridoxal 5'-phosphate synthase pdxS subunit